MLLNWIIKLKRSIIYVLLQIAYFQKVLNVSDMEYFMYPSMFRQFNVYNIDDYNSDHYNSVRPFHLMVSLQILRKNVNPVSDSALQILSSKTSS